MSLQKAKEDEFIRLRQGRKTVLEYASKFMKLSCFAPTYVADEKLKMNRFKAKLNPGIKEKMLVLDYTSYEDKYDTGVNIERATREKNEFYNEQQGMKRSGDQCGNQCYQHPHKRPRENFPNHHYSDNWQHFGTRPTVVCNACKKLGHYAYK